MWLIVAIVIGFVVGMIAKFVVPGRDTGGFFMTSLLGIGGSLVASYLGQALGWYYPGEPVGFLSSIIGAVVILLIFRTLNKRG